MPKILTEVSQVKKLGLLSKYQARDLEHDKSTDHYRQPQIHVSKMYNCVPETVQCKNCWYYSMCNYGLGCIQALIQYHLYVLTPLNKSATMAIMKNLAHCFSDIISQGRSHWEISFLSLL